MLTPGEKLLAIRNAGPVDRASSGGCGGDRKVSLPYFGEVYDQAMVPSGIT